MTEPPLRKRFQVHLSTAVVLMFAAGGLIWANVHEQNYDTVFTYDQVSGRVIEKRVFSKAERSRKREFLQVASGIAWEDCRASVYGWPCGSVSSINVFNSLQGEERRQIQDTRQWRAGPAVVDISTAILTLFAVWFICEWLSRRRAAPIAKGSVSRD